MKTILEKLFFVTSMLLCVTNATAHDFEVNGIFYDITDASNKTVAVTYRGTSPSNDLNEYTGSVVIPTTVNVNNVTYSVTSIGYEAFYECTGLTSITIPSSVTSIGKSAFRNCTGLTNVTIPNSVTSIGNYAFYNCSGLANVTIPNSVTSIGIYAYSGCTGLKEVHISDLAAWCGIDFEYDDSNPLYYAHNLYLNGELVTELVIPDGINEIKQYAFRNCTGLTNVTIPNSVTSIGNFAFYNCSGLANVTIPNSVTSIGNYAFDGCKGLTSITIPNSVTSIGHGAFYGCTGLTSITIPNSVTTIGNYAFYNCSGLTSVTIGNSVTSIGGSAFRGCTGLTSVTIGNSVTSIGGSAFRGCTGLKTVVNFSNLTFTKGSSDYGDIAYHADNVYNAPNGSIEEDYIFGKPNEVNTLLYYLGNRNELNLPVDYKGENYVIGDNVFKNYTTLTSVIIPNSVTSIGESAFYGCTGIKTVVNFSNSTFTKGSSGDGYIAYYANNVYNAPNGSIEEDYIFGKPNEVNTLLYYLGNRNELNLPVDYKGENYVIGDNVFKNYTTLTSVTIPNSVTSIGKGTFNGCKGLTSITIPNSVTSIGESAFYGCSGIKTVVNFSNSTFTKGSSDYGYIVYYADNVYNAPNGSIEEDYIFGKPNEVNTLLYYLGNRNELNLPVDYKGENYVIGDNVFKNYTTLTSVTIPNSVTSIGGSAFYGCTGLTSITIPNSVTSIGNSAFEGCTGITSVTIGNSVTSIGNSAFYGCTGLTSITIPNSVTNIGNYAFNGCKGLTSITIPNSVTSIGGSAFYGCTGLTSITIPNSVTSIGNSAFEGCTGITSVTIGNSVTSIGNSAFYGCTGLTSITIPNSVTNIGNYAFNGCKGLTSITIPNSVTSIGNSAYSGCTGIKEVHISELAAWCGIDFEDVLSNPLYYAHNLYLNGELVTELVITDGINEIKQYAFYNCTGLTSITIPSSVTSIGYGAFYDCSELTSITIPNSVTSIGESAFEGCTELESVTIGNSVRSIGCSAFNGCNNVMSIYNFSKKAITCSEDIFSTDTYNNATLYVPRGRVAAYSRTTPWNSFYIEEMKEFNITYIVDGEEYMVVKVEYGATIEPLEEPTKEGHTFSGWSEIPETMPAEDVTITGSFTANNYIVTFMIDGEVYDTATVEYGTEIELPTPPEKEGYIFSGWVGVPETMPAEDITITGSFTINSYIVTYIVDGEVYATDSIAYGATIEPLEEPTKEGHTFSSWSEIPETMPAEDITITGSFTANNYIVTFMIDGEVYDTATVEYDTEIELPTPPEKEGYIFSGWVGVPETMPAEDIVIEGSYEVDTTGINAIELDLERNEVYNLNGLRITETENLSRGFYIINGKKVYVK